MHILIKNFFELFYGKSFLDNDNFNNTYYTFFVQLLAIFKKKMISSINKKYLSKEKIKIKVE